MPIILSAGLISSLCLLKIFIHTVIWIGVQSLYCWVVFCGNVFILPSCVDVWVVLVTCKQADTSARLGLHEHASPSLWG